jgi:glycosyltransferase involved in cell wall biosynthesis
VKSKVLFILHLAPPVHGASVVGSYIQESKFITNAFDSACINLSAASDLADIGKSSVKKIVFIFQLYVNLIRYLLENKVDLCYLTINASGPAWLKELIIVAILKSFRVPIIYHYHNKGVRLNANCFWKRELYKFQFRQTKTILLSNLLREDISLFVSDQDIYICPNGIPQSGKSKLKHNPSEFCQILFLSNLIETKGVYVLLEACRLLKEKNIPFRCVYIGGEGDISEIELKEKIEKIGLDQFVEYHGKKYGLEKEKAFAEADIFAFPTFYHNETFGLVNLEAMQNSIPVVSTLEGGIPDIVLDGVTGYLVPKQNSQALADKLEILIKNPELRKEMGQAGKRLYEKKFTLEIFEKRMAEILQTVLNDTIA